MKIVLFIPPPNEVVVVGGDCGGDCGGGGGGLGLGWGWGRGWELEWVGGGGVVVGFGLRVGVGCGGGVSGLTLSSSLPVCPSVDDMVSGEQLKFVLVFHVVAMDRSLSIYSDITSKMAAAVILDISVYRL